MFFLPGRDMSCVTLAWHVVRIYITWGTGMLWYNKKYNISIEEEENLVTVAAAGACSLYTYRLNSH